MAFSYICNCREPHCLRVDPTWLMECLNEAAIWAYTIWVQIIPPCQSAITHFETWFEVVFFNGCEEGNNVICLLTSLLTPTLAFVARS